MNINCNPKRKNMPIINGAIPKGNESQKTSFKTKNAAPINKLKTPIIIPMNEDNLAGIFE